MRWALWVQGCSIGCPGCCNPDTWEAGGGFSEPVEDLIAQMLDAPVEGITLLGGEPFEQAEAVAVLAAAATAADLGVMTFTGYRYEVLRGGGRPGWAELLSNTDLLVDGPFLLNHLDVRRPWVGSTNQRFIHLTNRYRDAVDDRQRDRVEVRIRRDGTVAVNGWPEGRLLAAVEEVLEDL